MEISTSRDQVRSTEGSAAFLASKIQHTLITNALTEALWEKHIEECLKYHFNAAMIPGAWVQRTYQRLQGTGIRVASFIDFPNGTMTSKGKADEARNLVELGVEEIDLMPNVGFLLSGMEQEYFADINGVVLAAGKVPVKIMLELPLLNDRQKQRAVELSLEAGVQCLKNASGGAVGVATPEDMRFLRRLAPPHFRVKGSGGIKTAKQVRDLLDAGADLVGTSSGVQIMRELLDGEAAQASSSSGY